MNMMALHLARRVRTAPVGSRSYMPGVVNSVTDLIGRTPLVRLNRVVPEGGATVLVKLEMQNPGGSVKDRIALSMIEGAEARGEITPGKTTIVEATSGNTGIGLGMVAAAKGYKCIVVMPQVPSMYERYITARKFGCDVHLTAVTAEDVPLMIDMLLGHAKKLVAENDNYWSPVQFANDDNPKAHIEGTGPELWEQTGGEIDCFVAGAGTGGTMNGVGTFLKGKKPSCKCFLVEPSESRVLSGFESGMHGIVGIGPGLHPEVMQLTERLAPGQPFSEAPRGPIDEFLHASTPEAVGMANRLAAEEGLLVGPTSGATIKVAIDVAMRPDMAGKVIVALSASSAIRYVSHPMWEAEKIEAKEALPLPPDLETAEPTCRWRSDEFVPPPKE